MNKEYLSFGVDHFAFLPTGKKGQSVSDVAPTKESSASDAGTSQLPPEKDPPKGSAKPLTSGNVGASKGVEKAGTATAPAVEASEGDAVANSELRTPMTAYADFIEAFCSYMSSEGNNYLENTITELQIGLGPCGELRYPSYPMAADKWKFPGIGEFQTYDPHLLKDLAKASSKRTDAAASENASKWSVPPDGAGSYNDTPFSTTFFTHGFKSEHGKFFQEWYSRVLLRHCDDMLTNVRRIVPSGASSLSLAVKISGIHWWYFTKSRAAESTAGYYVSKEYNFYEEVAKLFKKHSVVFDFTCLEMKTINQRSFAAGVDRSSLCARCSESRPKPGYPSQVKMHSRGTIGLRTSRSSALTSGQKLCLMVSPCSASRPHFSRRTIYGIWSVSQRK